MPGLPLIRLAQVDSTQAFLRRHPELHPFAVMADTQSEGRGRQGNRWESAPGAGLWLSASLLPPDLPPGILLQRAMEGVIQALGPAGRELGLKWPNDLVARRGDRMFKLGGIIGERVGSRLILGLGINLATAPHLPDRAVPAASLADLGMPVPDSQALASSILQQWQDLTDTPPAPFKWPESGQAFRWEGGQGVSLGWEADGRLHITSAQGILRLSAGEIRGLS